MKMNLICASDGPTGVPRPDRIFAVNTASTVIGNVPSATITVRSEESPKSAGADSLVENFLDTKNWAVRLNTLDPDQERWFDPELRIESGPNRKSHEHNISISSDASRSPGNDRR